MLPIGPPERAQKLFLLYQIPPLVVNLLNSGIDVTPNYNQLNLWPLQFLRTGGYYRAYGQFNDRTKFGIWWANASAGTGVWRLYSTVGSVRAQAGSMGGDGYALRGVAKANQLANFPLNFLRTGYYECSDGKVYTRTTAGTWWSATRSSAMYANRLYTNTSGVDPQGSDHRGYGFAVRCVAAQSKAYSPPVSTLSINIASIRV